MQNATNQDRIEDLKKYFSYNETKETICFFHTIKSTGNQLQLGFEYHDGANYWLKKGELTHDDFECKSQNQIISLFESAKKQIEKQVEKTKLDLVKHQIKETNIYKSGDKQLQKIVVSFAKNIVSQLEYFEGLNSTITLYKRENCTDSQALTQEIFYLFGLINQPYKQNETLVDVFEDEGLLSNDNDVDIKSFHAYTIPNNPHTHLSINTVYCDVDFEVVVRLDGKSLKGRSLISFIKENWNKYLSGVDVRHCAYMINTGCINLNILRDWVNLNFDLSPTPNPFNTSKFNINHLGEDEVVDVEVSEEEMEYYYRATSLEQMLK